MSLITDIARSIKAGNDDTALNAVIQDYLDGDFYNGDSTTVTQWRIDNYTDLRRWAYPDVAVFNDAQVKINSGDTDMETEGNTQLSQYYTDCLTVKTRFPKE